MLAPWYDRQGPAAEALQYGELPDPPSPGEVRVTVSGANPGDTKKRRGWTGSARRQAARDLTVEVGDRFPLAEIAKAHDRVDAGGHGRVLIDVPR
ncbi:hypothetical protein IQ63_11090 [Streptomyces acidiscabies]|uniref:Zinc-binding dehydrogenase n=1 Tax=Streptomyces acidiscabies TaxID=42234 RepID=A0A0L0KFQ4_9ACTN|nr:hypothetical protein IQ63_11090 [Streptomyces acidiscabies]